MLTWCFEGPQGPQIETMTVLVEMILVKFPRICLI